MKRLALVLLLLAVGCGKKDDSDKKSTTDKLKDKAGDLVDKAKAKTMEGVEKAKDTAGTVTDTTQQTMSEAEKTAAAARVDSLTKQLADLNLAVGKAAEEVAAAKDGAARDKATAALGKLNEAKKDLEAKLQTAKDAIK